MSEAYALDYEEEDAGPAPFDLVAATQSPNLAFDLDESTLNAMGAKVVEEFGIDEESRKKEGWDKRYDDAMNLALQTVEAKNTPWPNASNIKFPLISTAAIQFNARAYPAIIDGPDVVKGAVRGQPTPEKTDRAERIGKHMSYQLLEQMDDWEEDTDKLLIQLPIVGCAFRKSYFDPLKGYNCSHLVSAKDFVVNYWTKDLDTCPRSTHVLTFYPHEVREKMLGGLWLDVDLGRPSGADNDDQAPYTFYEQYRLWDLDGDKYPEPYIITVEKESQRVVRVRARFSQQGVEQAEDGTVTRITAKRVFTKYGFIPAPDGSFYDIGFGTLLNALSETINSTLNQLMDAGKLANLQGGWIGGGVSIKSGRQGFAPGEWKKVDGGVGPLRDNILPMPVKEPSSVLFSLLGMLIEAAKDVTATQDILGGDSGKGSLPVGTVSALIEQGLKTFTAIVKRIHRALKKELGILYDLNAEFLEPQEYFTFQDVQGVVAQQDYAAGDMDVVPVSDPNMATDMQRMNRAQFVLEVAGGAGGDVREAGKGALKAARVPNDEIEKIFPAPQGPPPPDPKAIKAAADAEMDDRRTQIEAAEAAAGIAKTEAETEHLKAEMMMMGPEMAAYIEAQVRQGIREALAMVENGGSPQVRPEDGQGMGAGPANAPPEAVLPGPGGAPGEGMDLGGGGQPGPSPADEGAALLGAGDPGFQGPG